MALGIHLKNMAHVMRTRPRASVVALATLERRGGCGNTSTPTPAPAPTSFLILQMQRPWNDYLSTIGKPNALRGGQLTYTQFCGVVNEAPDGTNYPAASTASRSVGRTYRGFYMRILNPSGNLTNKGMPNCVGSSPEEPGSKKWGYKTAVTLPTGKSVTPQEAFGAWYKGESIVRLPHLAHCVMTNALHVHGGFGIAGVDMAPD
jgi:hypothetical protein